jgi:hypothetical protein
VVIAISSFCKFWSSYDPESDLVGTTSSPKTVDHYIYYIIGSNNLVKNKREQMTKM